MQQVNITTQNRFMIKIDCTKIIDFAFNDEKITKKSINHEVFNEMVLHFEKNGITFIDPSNVTLLYKKSCSKKEDFTNKTLEFGCKWEIKEKDILLFITALKTFGFVSETNTAIIFCVVWEEIHRNINYKVCEHHTTFEMLFARSFNTCETCIVINKPQNKENKWTYTTVRLN